MLFSALSQWREFVFMIATGFCMGGWYLAAELVRRGLRGGMWTNALSDVVMGAGMGAILSVALYLANGGKARLFLILAAMLGFLVFFHWVHRPLCRIVAKIWAEICAKCGNVTKKRIFNAIFR